MPENATNECLWDDKLCTPFTKAGELSGVGVAEECWPSSVTLCRQGRFCAQMSYHRAGFVRNAVRLDPQQQFATTTIGSSVDHVPVLFDAHMR